MSAPRVVVRNRSNIRAALDLTTKNCAVCGRVIDATSRNTLYCSHTCAVRADYRRDHGLPLRDADQPPKKSQNRYFITVRHSRKGSTFYVRVRTTEFASNGSAIVRVVSKFNTREAAEAHAHLLRSEAVAS